VNEIGSRMRVLISMRTDGGKPSLNEGKQTDTLCDLVSERSKTALLFLGIQLQQRIVELPVYNFRSAE